MKPVEVRLAAYRFVLRTLSNRLEDSKHRDELFPSVFAEVSRIVGVLEATVKALEETAAAIK